MESGKFSCIAERLGLLSGFVSGQKGENNLEKKREKTGKTVKNTWGAGHVDPQTPHVIRFLCVTLENLGITTDTLENRGNPAQYSPNSWMQILESIGHDFHDLRELQS